MSVHDEPTTQPLYRTWRAARYAASWMWRPREWPSSDDAGVLNAWTAGHIRAVLRALDDLARVRHLILVQPASLAHEDLPELMWESDVPYRAWLADALLTIETCAIPIISVEAELDLRVWFETADQPGSPGRRWLRAGADLDFTSQTHEPYGALSVGHTLFRDGNPAGDSNAALHRLNQPLLAEALARIEQTVGPIVDVDGIDVVPHGFASHG